MRSARYPVAAGVISGPPRKSGLVEIFFPIPCLRYLAYKDPCSTLELHTVCMEGFEPSTLAYNRSSFGLLSSILNIYQVRTIYRLRHHGAALWMMNHRHHTLIQYKYFYSYPLRTPTVFIFLIGRTRSLCCSITSSMSLYANLHSSATSFFFAFPRITPCS